MNQTSKASAIILGVSLVIGLAVLGSLFRDTVLAYKRLDRTVTVKGLSEREYNADVVIWPIQFSVAGNDLGQLYQSIDDQAAKVRGFLEGNGIAAAEITTAPPAITDKSAQQYNANAGAEFRYTGVQSINVYSTNIDAVRAVMGKLLQLGKQGIAFTGDQYNSQTEYLFTRLNEVKPEMIEEATRNAREVAQKFAEDSDSTLGKIRSASQGQFSISDRDRNNPHIKRVRVVSTVEYYLSD
ncbi:MAG: SIMPL domain-containing protein [Thiogranum sp.]|jgi:hypothetical protein|nr:SIMPL domain-containing protein [Thiogranum sp.]